MARAQSQTSTRRSVRESKAARYGPVPSPLAVTDTHALIWHCSGQSRRLGRAARSHFTRADAFQAVIYVPTLVLVEISEQHHLGRVRLASSFEQWLRALVDSRRYIVVDLNTEIVRASHNLFDIPERGDRLIAATAQTLDVPLMTRDAEIARCARVDRLWD